MSKQPRGVEDIIAAIIRYNAQVELVLRMLMSRIAKPEDDPELWKEHSKLCALYWDILGVEK